GREVVEAADERINLLRRPQDPVLFGDVFLHVVWFCGAKITQAPRKCKTAHKSDGAKTAAAGRCRMPVVLGRGVGFTAADGRLPAVGAAGTIRLPVSAGDGSTDLRLAGRGVAAGTMRCMPAGRREGPFAAGGDG